MMTESEIKEIVHRGTQAWDRQDLDKLMTIFHQDMVWPWPRTPHSRNPLDWIYEIGHSIMIGGEMDGQKSI